MTIDLATRLDRVDFMPKTELEEIAQNVKTIISTVKGQVFLDRGFGVSAELLDHPVPLVQNKLTAQIVEAVNKFEPRAKVTDVLYGGGVVDGELDITVRLKIIKSRMRGYV